MPSPRQKVDELAEVPEFRFVTGKFPVTPVVNGSPVQLVNTPALGVPKAGVVNVIFVAAIPLGNVVDQLGTLPALEINTELAAGVITPNTFAELAYMIVLIAFVAGYVVVDQAGVVLAPDIKSWLAVEVPANMAIADAVL